MQRDTQQRTAGMTVIELTTYAAVLFILGGPLVSAVLVSARTVAEGYAVGTVSERNRVVLERLASDVRQSVASSIAVSGAGRVLQLTLTEGVGPGGPILGDTLRYELRASSGETINGADDNGDGRTDEGHLVLTNVSTGEVVPLTEGLGLDVSGFVANGGSVTLTVSNVGRSPRGGAEIRVTRSLTVNPRN